MEAPQEASTPDDMLPGLDSTGLLHGLSTQKDIEILKEDLSAPIMKKWKHGMRVAGRIRVSGHVGATKGQARRVEIRVQQWRFGNRPKL